MDRGVSVTEQRLAEKLSILNDRGLGMITRIYNIKKVRSLTNALLKNLNFPYLLSADRSWLIVLYLTETSCVYDWFVSRILRRTWMLSSPRI